MKLAPEFHDNMTLQADVPVKIYGEADMPVTVSVDLHSRVHWPSDGTFEIELAPHKAGGPYTMFIECGGEITKIRDVYFK